MKNIVIYSVLFIIAFIGTTLTIYTYNQKYVNMFEFDFRNKEEVALADSLAALSSDSLAIADSLEVIKQEEAKKVELKENYEETQKILSKKNTELEKKKAEVERLKSQLEEKKKEKHAKWLKATIKLYEAMEAGKAAQLLKSLPQHEARELLYSMKNKKAAQILSSLDTETVKRLTRAEK